MDQLLTRREWMAAAASAAGAIAADARTTTDPAIPILSGKPRERGKEYGRRFKGEVATFRDREFGKALQPPATKEKVLKYADQCGRKIRAYAPAVMEELEGIAEGSGLSLEEIVLLN